MIKKTVSLREVAKRAGVSAATASRVFNGNPAVDPGAAAKVREAAEALGYRRNHAVSAVMRAWRRAEAPVFRGVVAALSVLSRAEWARRGAVYVETIFEGMEERGRELGLGVEFAPFTDTAAGARRLARVLRSRGVAGVALLPRPEESAGTFFPLEEFAAVRVGSMPRQPALHAVATDFGGHLKLLWEEAMARGYRRPGLVVSPVVEARLDHVAEAPFLRLQGTLPAADRVPVCEAAADRPADAARVAAWWRRWRPDVVIGHDGHALDALRAAGVRVPEDAAYLVTTVPPQAPGVSGVEAATLELGRVAVEHLSGQMLRGERGPPAWPQTLLITGRWSEGETCARR